MKKRSRIFLLLVLLLPFCGQSLSALQPEFSVMEEIRQEMNLLQSKKLRLMHSYNQILIQFQSETPNLKNSTENLPTNSEPLSLPAQNLPESSTTLQDLLNQGGSLFGMLDNQLAELQEQLTNSETTISSLQSLLSQANETTRQLSENLAKAQDWSAQMENRLAENNNDLLLAEEHAELLSQQNTALKNDAAKLRKQSGKSGLIGFGFGALGLGVGTPLIAEGIRSENPAMLWTGAGTIVGTAGIWFLGQYVFHWW